MEDNRLDGPYGNDGDRWSADDGVSSDRLTLPPCPAIPHTPEEIAAADAAARADIAAGRVYPHEEVSRWLRTWGSVDYKPFHEWRR